MSRILEALPFDCLQNVDLSEKRNKIASICAGFLFFSGWWFALDASASYYQDTRDVFHLCGVFATLSMFMVNAVSNSLLRGDGFTDGCLGPAGGRIWFFFGIMMGFGSLFGACYILFGEYVYISDNVNNTFKPDHTYPGVAFFLQNVFIFLSSLTFKFGRSEDMWG
eukprot:GFUD01042995.1.p1 GENE.GFUD01042995.1~~GFUD01042995.1.p1  ORF type:complete len:166 (+),score=32.31 GFUD01042995.1:431-928(+)